MDIELKQKLVALDVKDLTAAELYLFAVDNSLDFTKVRITAADRKRLESLNDNDPLTTIINNRVHEYRKLFKDTRGEGEQGQLRLVLKNLIKFFRQNPEYTFDDLLKITNQYIDSFYGSYKVMRQADYFLYKFNNGNWISPIEEFIQLNKEGNKEEKKKFILK